ncbi:pyridoxamine 5'-phosphate oxidase family protein [Ochrobactrum vermis]|uniref:Pyridoxamine 5'-phosphate oxidase family protein n=1 Tax=Ochrobactrum vermis TaxID=1827297 RepID=A0ABU8PFE1_9HYPH|nr:pyridoxamine 5'-phosphate oxidase family protein [Ochrobactrum vermis]PQZ25395.1 pyridoxamine 5'-phosphate oxidase [Ochrobactrum vermis]
MSSSYFHHIFGATARTLQEQADSRTTYALREAPSDDSRDMLTERELSFLQARDSIYLASVTADGWPYVQHRGGPVGFIYSLGENRIGFSDYPGNRQYISLGNVMESGRVALFAMNYPARQRLKLIGRARRVVSADAPEIVRTLSHSDAPHADVAFVIEVIGFDWNCPKFITPRFTCAEIGAAVAAQITSAVEREIEPLREENALLRAEIAKLKATKE